jgi:competence protein ComEC
VTHPLRRVGGDGRFVAVAASAWVGAVLGSTWPVVGAAAAAIGLGWAAVRGHGTALVCAVARGGGIVSGGAAHAREVATAEAWVPEGEVELVVTVASDPVGPPGGERITVRPDHLHGPGGWTRWRGPRLLVTGVPGDLLAGERVHTSGVLRPDRFRVLQGPVAGRLTAASVTTIAAPRNPLVLMANGLRGRVLASLRGFVDRPEGALLSGFLIGDVRRLPAGDYEALRLAGLSHFVVVSGSNVALFLAAFWIVSGPLGWSPRRRIIVGLCGIVLFAVVTRWEPSVLRASAMASAVLIGRLAGWHLSAVRALSLAATSLVLVSGGIVWDVGFQLSMAATAGIIAGAPLWVGRRPVWLWTTLGATLSAQLGVSPILLAHFGAVPLVAPATNLVSAPIVAASTAIGGIGALSGVTPLMDAATKLAGVVLGVARAVADFEQVGWLGVAVLVGCGVAAWRFPRVRGPAAVVGVLALGFTLLPVRPPAEPTAVFLDVGQGDATLFLGPDGEVLLIDGGHDPLVLRRHLRRHGVRRIDLLVVSHRHADHSAGLVGITAVARVRALWHPPQLGYGSALDDVVDEVRRSGAHVAEPLVGTTTRIGSFTVRVLGPVRRYASPNDGSVVVMVEANGVNVLMSGDIETHAQSDLGPLPSDIMKVPHQGAATSSPQWLATSPASVAVISVGPNTFGHPSQDVIAILEAGGAVVRRTDLEGSITIRLESYPVIAGALPSAP